MKQTFSIYLRKFKKVLPEMFFFLIMRQENNKYESFGHAKTRLRYHIIFSTKYRRKCLNEIHDKVIESFRMAEMQSHFRIHTMELDSDHIHFLISFPPAYSIEQTVRRLKMFSIKYLYDDFTTRMHLRKYYWKKSRVLWTHGYFCSTIGNVSEKTILNYIENQG